MGNTIDNANLLNICRDCGAIGFVPEGDYAFDAAAKTVTLNNTSTIPAGDTLKKTKYRIHDFFGGTVSGEIAAADVDQSIVADVSSLNLSKPLAISVVVITNGGIIADGGAYGLMAAGDVSYWDVEKNAAGA